MGAKEIAFETSILDHRWRVKFMPMKEYMKQWGADSAAITETEKKVLYFIQDYTNIETIRHELAHAYAAQLSLVELQLDDDQVEEFFCEMIGKYALRISMQAEDILAQGLKIAKRKKRKAK